MSIINVNKIEQYKKLIKDWVKTIGEDSVKSSYVENEFTKIANEVSFTLYCENSVNGIMDSLILAVDISYNELDNPTKITSLQGFGDMYGWDFEKMELFDMLSSNTKRIGFIKEHYNALYIEVDNFKFVVW